jgi:hypothetical protein
MSRKELQELAQQKSNGKFHIYMYIDDTVKLTKSNRIVFAYEFEKYLLENYIDKLL